MQENQRIFSKSLQQRQNNLCEVEMIENLVFKAFILNVLANKKELKFIFICQNVLFFSKEFSQHQSYWASSIPMAFPVRRAAHPEVSRRTKLRRKTRKKWEQIIEWRRKKGIILFAHSRFWLYSLFSTELGCLLTLHLSY